VAVFCAGRPDWDVLEVQLRDDGVALFRMQSEVNLPSPPGCFKRSCTNGPRTRQHAAAIQAMLGWPSLEVDDGDKAWVPLLLH
jgi:hypothetical protein